MFGCKRGISLIEVAIVLTITGVLAGGVLTGLELKQRYQLRKVIITSNENIVAIHQFRVKYAALPGDFATATQLWGRADGGTPITNNCASPTTNASVGKLTCNGDGNFIIDQTNCEYYRAWQHLVAAEFMPGELTGVGSNLACDPNSRPEVNVPVGAAEGSGFSIASFGDISGSPLLYDGNYNNVVIFGKLRAGDYTANPILTPGEALEVDRKIDEGRPGEGKMRVFKPSSAYSPLCATNSTTYNVAYKDPACSIIFMNSYLNNNAM